MNDQSQATDEKPLPLHDVIVLLNEDTQTSDVAVKFEIMSLSSSDSDESQALDEVVEHEGSMYIPVSS